MRILHLTTTSALALPLTAAVTAQNHVVAPAAHAATNALSYEWIAGASRPLRQQTLIGQSHLQPLVGRAIQAIELRRTAANEIYQGGSMNLTVSLSTSPNQPVTCSNRWGDNIGFNVIQVFSGTVTLPTSPATATGVGTPVAWTPNNTLRITFQTPYVYSGGTLCVDVTGQPIGGQEANWWMADAAEEVVPGSAAVEIGSGCGPYGGPQSQWSSVATRSLIPGGRAQFRANGAPNGMALAVFGAAAPAPIPLSALGIGTPNCFAHLNPAQVLISIPAMFEAQPQLPPTFGLAEVLVEIPNHPSWFGMQLTTQWFDLTYLSTSNAFTWTVASAAPALDMALNEGHPQESTGQVSTYLAHVMRFEYL